MTINRIFKILFLILLLAMPCFAQTDDVNLNQDLRYTERRLNEIEGQTQDRVLLWFIPNALTTGTDKSGRLDLPFSGTIIKATAYCKTAPTGSSLIFDINKNGSTIWATQANRITIAATATTGSQTAFDTTTVSANDYFTIDIDQIGSTLSGENATVQLIIRVNLND